MSLKDSLEKINEECAEKIVELQRRELDLIVNHELEELASIEVGIDRIIKIIKKNNEVIKELTPTPINFNPIRGNNDFFKAPDWSSNPLGGDTVTHCESCNISTTSAPPLNQDEFISVCDDATKEAVNKIFEKNALRFEGPGENLPNRI